MTDHRPVVIGIGNVHRRDDAAGLAVIEQLIAGAGAVAGARLATADGDPFRLLELWAGRPLAIVVDVVRCQPGEPGRVHRSDGGDLELPAGVTTSHSLGLGDAILLGGLLDRAPDQLIGYAIEAADLGMGLGLSRAVAAAIGPVVAAIRSDLQLAELPDPTGPQG